MNLHPTYRRASGCRIALSGGIFVFQSRSKRPPPTVVPPSWWASLPSPLIAAGLRCVLCCVRPLAWTRCMSCCGPPPRVQGTSMTFRRRIAHCNPRDYPVCPCHAGGCEVKRTGHKLASNHISKTIRCRWWPESPSASRQGRHRSKSWWCTHRLGQVECCSPVRVATLVPPQKG